MWAAHLDGQEVQVALLVRLFEDVLLNSVLAASSEDNQQQLAGLKVRFLALANRCHANLAATVLQPCSLTRTKTRPDPAHLIRR